RERNVNVMPPYKVMQVTLVPDAKNISRLISSDYTELISEYEEHNQRKNVKAYSNLSLVDFMSEDENGNMRCIILTVVENFVLSINHQQDLEELPFDVFIYVIQNNQVVKECKWKGR
nr:helicase [Bacillus pacificus]